MATQMEGFVGLLEARGIRVDRPARMDDRQFGVSMFGGGLHCATLDIKREGGMEDYFPRQIPGF